MIPLNIIDKKHSRKLLEITHFVNLFCEELAQIKYSVEQKSSSSKMRVQFERMKLEESERKRLEYEDMQEEIRLEKERAKRKFAKGKKTVKRSAKVDSTGNINS